MTPSWVRKGVAWIKSRVGDVPDDIAQCEYDCRKPQCRQGEWEACERRVTCMEQSSAAREGKSPPDE